MRVYKRLFNEIIGPENLFLAWREFRRGKSDKSGVVEFERQLESHVFQLHRELANKSYRHGSYISFFINDPKRRHVHKATIRDRLLHHAVFRVLNLVFDPTFISPSFSCRTAKGTLKGVDHLRTMLRQVSRNHTIVCYVLKCDIRQFFASIDHSILLTSVKKKIKDPAVIWLVKELVESYQTEMVFDFTRERERESKNTPKIGLPIGNLTSQLFANLYLNQFDQFVKHKLKVKHYARYTDDFVIVAQDPNYLKSLLEPIKLFLAARLKLELHPNKVEVRKCSHGIDFLGYVALPHYRVLRQRTKRRMFRKLALKMKSYQQGKLSKEALKHSLLSYLGILSHANTYKLGQKLKNWYWFGPSNY